MFDLEASYLAVGVRRGVKKKKNLTGTSNPCSLLQGGIAVPLGLDRSWKDLRDFSLIVSKPLAKLACPRESCTAIPLPRTVAYLSAFICIGESEITIARCACTSRRSRRRECSLMSFITPRQDS